MGFASRKAEADFLRRARTEALAEQAGFCIYCFEPLTVARSTADHRVPRSKGGTNARSNIVACCGPCNRAKGSMSAGAFAKAIRRPEAGAITSILMAWARRRIWLASHRTCRNIKRAAGLPNDGPVGQRAQA